MAEIQRALPAPLRERVQFVSVSMDPARDTAPVLKQFASSVGADLAGWSSSRATSARSIGGTRCERGMVLDVIHVLEYLWSAPDPTGRAAPHAREALFPFHLRSGGRSQLATIRKERTFYGQVIRWDAAVEDILADAQATLTNAKARDGQWHELAEQRLGSALALHASIEVKLKAAEEALAPLVAKVAEYVPGRDSPLTARLTAPPSRIARLGALAVGAALLTACLAGCESGGSGGKGLPTVEEQAAGMVPGAALVEPPDLNTETPAEMTVQLTTAKHKVMISGKEVLAETYNGSLVGPTLHVVPGQRVTLHLKNDLDTPTNLHFHGLHLSPEGNADNIFLSTKPGQTLTYHLDIPANHPVGTYWYHDHEMCGRHRHPMPGRTMPANPANGRCDGTESQIGAGLSGTIIVGDTRESLPPAYRSITTHTLVLKDAQINGASSIVYPDGILEPASPTVRLVNGQYQPTLNLEAGETQLWRIANEGYAIFYDLQLDGGSFTVVNQDGVPSAAPAQVNHLLMPPGRRFDVLVTAGAPGSTTLRTLAYTNGAGQAADEYPDTTLMTVNVQQGSGSAAGGPSGMTTSPQVAGPLPGALPDLSGEPVAQSRGVELTDDGGSNFWINGKLYDGTPTFTEPAVLGTVEEWTLTNKSEQNHPFHLHTAPFQVLNVNGVAQPPSDYMDVVNVPSAVDGVAGKVVIRIRFTDFTGQWMFHCHITGHEDNGMMGSVPVIAD